MGSGSGFGSGEEGVGRMQPRKLYCCIFRDLVKPSLRFSFFCVFFVSNVNLLVSFYYVLRSRNCK